MGQHIRVKVNKERTIKWTNLVILKRNRTTTTSLIVSEKFGKRHDNVIQRIENLSKEDESGRLNFKESSYINSQNKEQKMYKMDKHSFIILAMRFTGKKALKWQHIFVDAFEAMELAIVRQQNIAWNQARLEGSRSVVSLPTKFKSSSNMRKNRDRKTPGYITCK